MHPEAEEYRGPQDRATWRRLLIKSCKCEQAVIFRESRFHSTRLVPGRHVGIVIAFHSIKNYVIRYGTLRRAVPQWQEHLPERNRYVKRLMTPGNSGTSPQAAGALLVIYHRPVQPA